MDILNITYAGRSGDVPEVLAGSESDDDLRRYAVELIRAGTVVGLHVPDLAPDALDNFVIDRLPTLGRVYVRPKVPFGATAPTHSH